MTAYIGVDVSKNKLDFCWLRDPSLNKKKSKVFSNKDNSYQEVVDWLLHHTQQSADQIQVLFEPTGVYHERLVHYLYEEGFIVVLVNPGKSKKYAEAIGLIHKTDKGDAEMLARYGSCHELPQWQPEAPEIRELKSMMRRLDALEKDLQREKNRQESTECGVMSARVRRSLLDMIEVLEEEIAKLTADIDDHIDRHPQMKDKRQLLESIRGVGPVLSREMVYLLSAKSFTKARQVAAYVGLIPKRQESGKWKGRSCLSKVGPSRLRAKLYMAAVCASTHNPDIREQKERLLKSGKTVMQALGAAMRKLIQICFGVVKHQSEYRPQAV